MGTENSTAAGPIESGEGWPSNHDADRIVLCTEAWNDDVLHDLEPYVYEWVSDRRGSISAEHGLGQMKSQYIG